MTTVYKRSIGVDVASRKLDLFDSVSTEHLTIDARMIARFAEVVTPKLREKPSPEERKLKALVHRRDQILSQQSAERNRLAQARDEEVRDVIQ